MTRTLTDGALRVVLFAVVALVVLSLLSTVHAWDAEWRPISYVNVDGKVYWK